MKKGGVAAKKAKSKRYQRNVEAKTVDRYLMEKPDTQDGIVRQYLKDMALPAKK